MSVYFHFYAVEFNALIKIQYDIKCPERIQFDKAYLLFVIVTILFSENIFMIRDILKIKIKCL